MKLFYLLSSIAKRGGVERTFIDKANYLASQGHDITLITYEQAGNPYAYPLSSIVKHIDLDCRLYTIYKYRLFRREMKRWEMKRKLREKLKELVSRESPDILVTSTYSAEVITEIMSVKRDVKIVLESHTAAKYDTFIGILKKIYNYLFTLRYMKKCDLLIALTKGDASFWRRHISNVMVVPNPVSFYKEDLAINIKEKGRIISVGRLHQVKRFDRLIEAFSIIADKYPEWHVDIFGEGNLRGQLEELIQKCNLQNQFFIHQPTNSIYEEYIKSEFYVLSSDHEGLPLVLLEAMACGIPVVSVDCPYGPSEIVEDGNTGLLSKIDKNDLAEKMEWMIVHKEERLRMGCMAHEKSARYKKEIVMKEWENAYVSVINKNNNR